nr:GAF and ANTAR domain-containing protein [Aeromicrobium duanguangcaii]
MADAARELEDQHDPAATVKNAVELLVRHVEACSSASISLVYSKRRVETPAASDDLAALGDQLQEQLSEGPALSTLWEHETVYIPNLIEDARWPRWGPHLAEATGARTVLTLRLFTLSEVIGALSMYSTEVDAFTAEDQAEGLALAAHIAIAVLAAQKVERYETALDSRAIIGQACGLLMERYDIDATRAFALLTRVSSTENVKLRSIAAELHPPPPLTHPGPTPRRGRGPTPPPTGRSSGEPVTAPGSASRCRTARAPGSSPRPRRPSRPSAAGPLPRTA